MQRKMIPLYFRSILQKQPFRRTPTTWSTQDTANCTKSSIMLDLLQEGSDVDSEDNICLFLKATATADVDIDPLQWWLVNSRRFPTL